jgi:hypothetical protein
MAELLLRVPRWDATCLFCGEGLPDEGAGFLDHIGIAPGCETAYRSWLEHLDEDHPGG